MSNTERLAPGVVLGRYELLLPIAQGGMATVWAARQKGSRGFQKTVAIKTILPNLSDDPQFETMFLDEASLAARIHHPNVAEILDLGEQEEILYLVMEWVDGEAISVLSKTIKRSETYMPQRIALRIVAQACAGLHAAHELKDENDVSLELVHRDVSPQNILVTYDGVVKMVDFGVAKALGRASGETTAGQLKGKVPYMSPEQARGGKVDRRTDVFAMGIVLYRLTTGVHPFLGENDIATMRNIIARPVMSPRVKNPDFSPDLEQLLMTCLHKDPDQRFQTIADLDRAIERVLARGGVSVVDDDVGAFVRGAMGDRGQKRRAALRDAVRAADERAAGLVPSTAGGANLMPEGLSDLIVTRLGTGIKDDLIPSSLLNVPVDALPAGPPSQPFRNEFASESVILPLKPKRTRAIVAASVASALVIGGVIVAATHASSAPAPAASGPTAVTPVAAAMTATSPVVATVAPAATAAPTASTDDPKKGLKSPAEVASSAPAPAPRGPMWRPSVNNPGF